ncbi:uncharacterized protein LALA0_S11e00936g [Lachancea lanzarotensis]|uniref:LALA0S11e00936g1_1 n=1 Tax=Lachancea lanzarotensis TaxID=1245769 RepID=A0A0C7N8R2_9SACH|nr:uncharacterized protein LALA0_S11e00936g [Lachancea lanzarotensis]CEP64297.1 LALA0S11e00936g1_1 [Lachancea lanzarotensis]
MGSMYAIRFATQFSKDEDPNCDPISTTFRGGLFRNIFESRGGRRKSLHATRKTHCTCMMHISICMHDATKTIYMHMHKPHKWQGGLKIANMHYRVSVKAWVRAEATLYAENVNNRVSVFVFLLGKWFLHDPAGFSRVFVMLAITPLYLWTLLAAGKKEYISTREFRNFKERLRVTFER